MLEVFLQSLFRPENSLVLFFVFFIIRYAIFTTLENIFGAHPFNRNEVLLADITTILVYGFVVFPMSQFLSLHTNIQATPLSHLATLPLPLRVLLFFIIADFLHYFIHRLMHTSVLWRTHMWHHSPKHMSWMGGYRATVFDAALVNLAFIFAWPILGTVQYPLLLFIFMCSILLNDWMHLNVAFKIPWLERVLVTPRYHHIHHSTKEEHYLKNLAAIFPIWDKLFGTYIDPDTIGNTLTFGIKKQPSAGRLIIGV